MAPLTTNSAMEGFEPQATLSDHAIANVTDISTTPKPLVFLPWDKPNNVISKETEELVNQVFKKWISWSPKSKQDTYYVA